MIETKRVGLTRRHVDDHVTNDATTSNVWKIRVVKSYPEAQNHLLVGTVLANNSVCIKMKCRSFHFGRLVHSLKDIRTGSLGIRIIPWSQIEIINVLPTDFHSHDCKLDIDSQGNIFLNDQNHLCPLVTKKEPRQ